MAPEHTRGPGGPVRLAGRANARDPVQIRTTDYHTAGEPFRIVADGFPAIAGSNVLHRRERASRDEYLNWLRRSLCHEPRGHADMYGCFIVPANDRGAKFGALFWHKDGFSTACGHGTIALGVWAAETGLIDAPRNGSAQLRIDVPSGRVQATVHCRSGKPEAVTFKNVPSYVLHRNLHIRMDRTRLRVDLSYGGAIYACVAAADLGLSVTPQHYLDLVSAGRRIKAALNKTTHVIHPYDKRLSGVYGVTFYDDLDEDAARLRQRNVTVFADGEVDRSPCGSGTSARLAVLVGEGRVNPETTFVHESIIGTRFTARVTGHVTVGEHPAVLTEVTGTAHKTGEHSFFLDPSDPLGAGFVLR